MVKATTGFMIRFIRVWRKTPNAAVVGRKLKISRQRAIGLYKMCRRAGVPSLPSHQRRYYYDWEMIKRRA